MGKKHCCSSFTSQTLDKRGMVVYFVDSDFRIPLSFQFMNYDRLSADVYDLYASGVARRA